MRHSFLLKAALIIGVFGSCRRVELKDMSLDQMVFSDNPNGVLITLPRTKTDVIRQFVVGEGDRNGINLINVVKSYAALRPPDMDSQRFFTTYRNGVCIRQLIGIHALGGYPKAIATFLNLPNPSTYTGHCYRRSGVSLMAESGATLADMRRHCGWMNEGMAERYIELSVNNKRKIAGHILGTKAPSTLTGGTVNAVGVVSGIVSPNATLPANSFDEPIVEMDLVDGDNEMYSVDTVIIQSQISSVKPLATAAMKSNITASTHSQLNIKQLSNCTININYHK